MFVYMYIICGDFIVMNTIVMLITRYLHIEQYKEGVLTGRGGGWGREPIDVRIRSTLSSICTLDYIL